MDHHINLEEHSDKIFQISRDKYTCHFRKGVLGISSVDNIISGDCKMGHCAIIKNFDVDRIISYALLILKNCDHCIKESMPLSYSWRCHLNLIYKLKIKWTIISI